MFCKQQTLYFTLKNHTATLHSGDQVALSLHRFNGVSAILDAKVRKIIESQTLLRNFNTERRDAGTFGFCVMVVGVRGGNKMG